MTQQQFELLRPLDALCSDFKAEAFAQPDDGAHDGRRARVAIDARDETAIQLDTRERQLF
jgi:hypothetical protein